MTTRKRHRETGESLTVPQDTRTCANYAGKCPITWKSIKHMDPDNVVKMSNDSCYEKSAITKYIQLQQSDGKPLLFPDARTSIDRTDLDLLNIDTATQPASPERTQRDDIYRLSEMWEDFRDLEMSFDDEDITDEEYLDELRNILDVYPSAWHAMIYMEVNKKYGPR
jgi:hypothetical protein